ncbi:MAG: tRNA pseudouridine(38-40) synthase TruA [Pyrobaculum sp.]
MPYLYRIAYDGALFYGFTGHPNSVETKIRPAFGEILGKGSRTDPGVSAVANVVMAREKIRLELLNSRLPRGVWAWAWAEVDEGFNPRRALWRRYLYVAPYWGEDLQAMRQAAELFKGTHDYASFIRGGRDTVTTIFDIEIYIRDDLLYIHYIGKGFRNKMLRKITWAILGVGRGALDVGYISQLLKEPRPGAVPHAPAEGLLLLDIHYDVSFHIDLKALRSAYLHFLKRWRSLRAYAATYRAAGEALAAFEE